MPCRHDGQTYDRNAARGIGRIVFEELDLRGESNDQETLRAEMPIANKTNSPTSTLDKPGTQLMALHKRLLYYILMLIRNPFVHHIILELAWTTKPGVKADFVERF